MDKDNELQIEEEDLKAWHELPHPQDELPTEVVQMYVMKDYRRMFDSFEKYKRLAAMNVKQIEGRALAIASRRKPLSQELVELKLAVEDRDRKINEMYEWLHQKDAMIASLCKHCVNQRDQLTLKEKNLAAQRQQIQSLLSHFGEDEGREVLADCDASWDADRWKAAMVNINAVGQQLGELRGAVRRQEMDENVKEAILSVIRFICSQTRRAYNCTATIASTILRREFAVETVPEDEDKDNEY